MNLLWDTHTLLWMLVGDTRMSPTARAAIATPGARNCVSVASLWEVAIKSSIGKLILGDTPIAALLDRIESDRLHLLPINAHHCARIAKLFLHHRDPFDRMLVAQALEDDLAIVSADPALDRYGIVRVW